MDEYKRGYTIAGQKWLATEKARVHILTSAIMK
jgi:hypothetical protein